MKEEVLTVLHSMYSNARDSRARRHSTFLVENAIRTTGGVTAIRPSSFLRARHTNLSATVNGRLWFGGEETRLKNFYTSVIKILDISLDLPVHREMCHLNYTSLQSICMARITRVGRCGKILHTA